MAPGTIISGLAAQSFQIPFVTATEDSALKQDSETWSGFRVGTN